MKGRGKSSEAGTQTRLSVLRESSRPSETGRSWSRGDRPGEVGSPRNGSPQRSRQGTGPAASPGKDTLQTGVNSSLPENLSCPCSLETTQLPTLSCSTPRTSQTASTGDLIKRSRQGSPSRIPVRSPRSPRRPGGAVGPSSRRQPEWPVRRSAQPKTRALSESPCRIPRLSKNVKKRSASSSPVRHRSKSPGGSRIPRPTNQSPGRSSLPQKVRTPVSRDTAKGLGEASGPVRGSARGSKSPVRGSALRRSSPSPVRESVVRSRAHALTDSPGATAPSTSTNRSSAARFTSAAPADSSAPVSRRKSAKTGKRKLPKTSVPLSSQSPPFPASTLHHGQRDGGQGATPRSSSPRSNKSSDTDRKRRKLPKAGGKHGKLDLEEARESDVESGYGECVSINISIEHVPSQEHGIQTDSDYRGGTLSFASTQTDHGHILVEDCPRVALEEVRNQSQSSDLNPAKGSNNLQGVPVSDSAASSYSSQDNVVLAVLEADRAMQELMVGDQLGQRSNTGQTPQDQGVSKTMDNCDGNVTDATVPDGCTPVRVMLIDEELSQTVSQRDAPTEASEERGPNQTHGQAENGLVHDTDDEITAQINAVPVNGSQEAVMLHTLVPGTAFLLPTSETMLQGDIWMPDSPNISSQTVRRHMEVLQHEMEQVTHVLQPNTNLTSKKSERDEDEEDVSSFITDNTESEGRDSQDDAESWVSGLTEPDLPIRCGSRQDFSTQTPRHRTTQTPEDACTQTPDRSHEVSNPTESQELTVDTHTSYTDPRGTAGCDVLTDNGTRNVLLQTMPIPRVDSTQSATGPPDSGTLSLPATRDLPEHPSYIQAYQRYIESFDGTASEPFVPGDCSGPLENTVFAESLLPESTVKPVAVSTSASRPPQSVTTDTTGAKAMPMPMLRDLPGGAESTGNNREAQASLQPSSQGLLGTVKPQERLEQMILEGQSRNIAVPTEPAEDTADPHDSSARNFATQTFGQMLNVTQRAVMTQTGDLEASDIVVSHAGLTTATVPSASQMPDSLLLIGQPVDSGPAVGLPTQGRSSGERSKKKKKESNMREKPKKHKHGVSGHRESQRPPDTEAERTTSNSGMTRKDILKFMLRQVRELKAECGGDQDSLVRSRQEDGGRSRWEDGGRSRREDGGRGDHRPRPTRRHLEFMEKSRRPRPLQRRHSIESLISENGLDLQGRLEGRAPYQAAPRRRAFTPPPRRYHTPPPLAQPQYNPYPPRQHQSARRRLPSVPVGDLHHTPPYPPPVHYPPMMPSVVQYPAPRVLPQVPRLVPIAQVPLSNTTPFHPAGEAAHQLSGTPVFLVPSGQPAATMQQPYILITAPGPDTNQPKSSKRHRKSQPRSNHSRDLEESLAVAQKQADKLKKLSGKLKKQVES